MIAVVAPEPAPWLSPLLAALRAQGPVAVFAPWRLPAVVVARLWSRGRTDRQMAARFALRMLADRAAEPWLPRDVDTVVAPSLAARRVFAAASARGIRRVLVEDLPALRQLHDDLDVAAGFSPGCAWLTRYRAPAGVVAHQEAERLLADRLLVRGHFARELRQSLGFTDIGEVHAAVHGGARPVVLGATVAGRRSVPTVLLAGVATARNGLELAMSVAAARPSLRLLVNPGEATPPEIFTLPNVRKASPAEAGSLVGVDLVLAPAWCEAYPPEVPRASALGKPIVATRRASGFVNLALAGREVAPGDQAGLIASLDELLYPRQNV